MDLTDRIILVTGGSGLIGKEILNKISEFGGIPYNLDIIKEADNENSIYCDITSSESIQIAINHIIKQQGRIDGLVNNAYPRTKDWGVDFELIPEDSWKQNIDWQLNSCFMFCQKVIPHMLKNGHGSIVNIASIYGVQGNDFTIYKNTDIVPPAAYSAVKGGVINFTRYLASKYSERNIRVNTVSPGGVFNNQNINFVTSYEKRVPIRRMAKPEEIAGPIVFLLSESASYVTGHNLIVDGGWTIS